MLTFWVHFDKRACGFRVPYEFDAFVFFAWSIVIPYYMYKTRAKRGLLWGAGVWGLFIAPFLAAAIVKVGLTK